MLAGLAWLTVGPAMLSLPAQAALDSTVVVQQQSPLAEPRPLADSLIALGQQSDISIVFPSRLLEGKLTPAINPRTSGRQSTLSALDQLLAGSGLTYKVINSQVIAITPAIGPTGKPDEQFLNSYLEEISVIGQPITGSRIRRSYAQGASPVDIISGPDLEASGAQSLGEFLKFIPTVAGNSTSTAVSNGGDGTATVTLRGLPANNTLVLLNGQRIASGGLAGDAIDLNSIPPAAVERIEILKDGASAVYGSDAIAGVINIILKHSYEGLQLEQFYGETSRQDLETSTTSLLWGSRTDSATFMVSASHFVQQGIDSRDRNVSANADSRARGGADLRSSATPDGRFSTSTGVVTLRDGQDGSEASEFRPATDEDLFNHAQYTSSVSPSSRTSVYGSARFELNYSASAFADLSYTTTEATISLAPAPLFTDFEASPLTIGANNPYNPFGEAIADGRKRLLELGLRDQHNRSESTRFNWGIEAAGDRVHWQLNQFVSRTEAEVRYANLASGLRTAEALGDHCSAPCVPLNLFGPAGSIEPAQLDYIRTESRNQGHSQLIGLTLSADAMVGETSAGEILAAGGLEFRHESTESHSDPLPAGEFLIGGGDTSHTRGDRTVSEAFAELHLPLLSDRIALKSLELDLAARLSNYSDFGNAVTPKVGLTYQALPGLILRGTYSQGFRAPSLTEIHQSNLTSQQFLNDPCTVPDQATSLPGCGPAADPTRTQFLTVFGGSEALKPERAINQTLGLSWAPNSLPGLSASADWFWIDQRNVVDASAQFIVNHNAQTGELTDRVIRNNAGDIQEINASYLNIGSRQLSGTDLALRYQHLLADGMATFSLNAAHLQDYQDQLGPSAAPVELAGTFADAAAEGKGALPEWKANTGLHWQQGGLNLHYTINYISALTETVPKSGDTRDISQWITHDLQFNYLLNIQKGLRITLGADNLLDAPAPFVASAFNDNTDSRTYDLKGRYWYGRVSLKF